MLPDRALPAELPFTPSLRCSGDRRWAGTLSAALSFQPRWHQGGPQGQASLELGTVGTLASTACGHALGWVARQASGGLTSRLRKEKWLNSTNDIIKLKCPNSVGVFSVSTLRMIIEVRITASPVPPKAAFVGRPSVHERGKQDWHSGHHPWGCGHIPEE